MPHRQRFPLSAVPGVALTKGLGSNPLPEEDTFGVEHFSQVVPGRNGLRFISKNQGGCMRTPGHGATQGKAIWNANSTALQLFPLSILLLSLTELSYSHIFPSVQVNLCRSQCNLLLLSKSLEAQSAWGVWWTPPA